jgi:hypothetical protein
LLFFSVAIPSRFFVLLSHFLWMMMQDTRVFYVGKEMWLLNSCFEGGSCKGYWNDIYRVPLYVRASGNATHPRLRAYVVSPKTPLAPLGKNFVFFEAQQRHYMMLNIHKMELHNMGTGLPARSIMPNLGLFGAKTVMGEGAHNWHLQGGALVAWNTKRHSGTHAHVHAHDVLLVGLFFKRSWCFGVVWSL